MDRRHHPRLSPRRFPRRRGGGAIDPPKAYLAQPCWVKLDDVSMPGALAELVERDPYPLPTPIRREGYSPSRHMDYWASGLHDYLRIRQGLEQRHAPLAAGASILDLGCSSGRVLRHFLCHGDRYDLWGADINARNIAWMREHLPPSLRVFQNTALPHLPLEDRSLDLVYALSVFTHIDELEAAWLLELRRILKPGGVIFLSVLTEHAWSKSGPGTALYNNLVRKRDKAIGMSIDEDFFRRPLPGPRFVIPFKGRRHYHCNVFHSRDYIRREWGRFMQVLDILDGGFAQHDAVILRKV